MKPIFSIIVAVSENDVIGMQGQMPWKKLPSDLKYFKDQTTGHWCILGRKTYNALNNQALPGRKFIIITRDKHFVSDDSIVVHSLEEAIHHPAILDEEEVFILGGGDIYRQAMPYIHRIHLTRIYDKFEGDTFFYSPGENWKLISTEHRKADQKNPYDHDFLVYERK